MLGGYYDMNIKKLFESQLFNQLLISGFFMALLVVMCAWEPMGWEKSELAKMVINIIFSLWGAFIVLSLPLFAAFQGEQEQKAEESMMVLLAVARYIVGEILDNIIEIEDIEANNEKSFSKLAGVDVEKRVAQRAEAGIWQIAARELSASLEDKHLMSMVQSGIMVKIENQNLADDIRMTYQKMDNLKKRLKRMSGFLAMLLSDKEHISPVFEDYNYNVKVPQGINAVKLDIKIFKDQARTTVDEINGLLAKYGKKMDIARYEEDRKEELQESKTKGPEKTI